MMSEDPSNFSYGTYGDVHGVDFWGPPQDGFWNDCLPVSDRFVEPLFRAVLERAMETGRVSPRLVAEWNSCTGWTEATTRVQVPPQDAQDMVEALRSLSRSDAAVHCREADVQDILRCADVVAEFLATRLASGFALFISRS